MANLFYMQDDPSVGLVHRPKTNGPEIEMVKEFLNNWIHAFVSNDSNLATYVFIEPKIDSGYPDLVIAIYDKTILDQSCVYGGLTRTDYKILAFIMRKRYGTESSISRNLGFNSQEISKSLKRLENFCLVIREKNGYRSVPRRNFFGLKNVIAIEAKIGNTKKALDQAVINKRFSTDSYVLTNVCKPTFKTCSQCEKLGIGLIINEGSKVAVKPKKLPIAINHISLKINEWIRTRIFMETINE